MPLPDRVFRRVAATRLRPSATSLKRFSPAALDTTLPVLFGIRDASEGKRRGHRRRLSDLLSMTPLVISVQRLGRIIIIRPDRPDSIVAPDPNREQQSAKRKL